MALPKKIDPEAQYAITLSAPVTVGKRVLVPRLSHTVKGKVIETIKESVSDAKLVEAAS